MVSKRTPRYRNGTQLTIGSEAGWTAVLRLLDFLQTSKKATIANIRAAPPAPETDTTSMFCAAVDGVRVGGSPVGLAAEKRRLEPATTEIV
jgi:hypothetical protein